MQVSSLSTNVAVAQKPRIGALQSVLTFLRNRKNYKHLRTLPQYLLDDIGLSHNDIEAAERANRLFG